MLGALFTVVVSAFGAAFSWKHCLKTAFSSMLTNVSSMEGHRKNFFMQKVKDKGHRRLLRNKHAYWF